MGPNILNPIAYHSEYKEEASKQYEQWSFDSKAVKNMQSRVDINRLTGNIMLERGQKYEHEEDILKSEQAYTAAGKEFVKSIEKTQKVAMQASGNGDAKYINSDKKIIQSHNNTLIQRVLKEKTKIEIISKVEAELVDNIHKNEETKGYEKLSYIALEYGSKLLNQSECIQLKQIDDKACAKLANLKEEVRKEKLKSSVDVLLNKEKRI